MPYTDPERQRAANRAAQRRRRAKSGAGLAPLAAEPDGAVGAEEPLPEPPSRDEMLKALGVQARAGNVPAIRLLLEEYRRDGDTDEKPALSAIDQLAARRAART